MMEIDLRQIFLRINIDHRLFYVSTTILLDYTTKTHNHILWYQKLILLNRRKGNDWKCNKTVYTQD